MEEARVRRENLRGGGEGKEEGREEERRRAERWKKGGERREEWRFRA